MLRLILFVVVFAGVHTHTYGAARHPFWRPSSSFTFEEFVARGHVDEITRRGREWFDRYYNYIGTPYFMSAMRNLTNELSNPNSLVSRRVRSGDFYRKLYDQKVFLQQLGEEASISGDSLYYPFGGFDVLHSFGLSDQIRDVYSMGAEGVGATSDYLKWLVSAPPEVQAAAPLMPFDATEEYRRVQRLARINSLAPVVISRLLIYLDATLHGLFFFNLTKDGKVKFSTIDTLNLSTVHSNFLLIFTQNIDGKTVWRRFWYFKHLINDSKSNFPQLVSKLRFQTMLIKAAPDMWDAVPERGKSFRREVLRLTINPAKRNNSLVITDHRLAERDHQKRTDPPPIFKKKSFPRPVVVRGSMGFGYSMPGEYVYIGSAKDLVAGCPFFLR